MSLDVLITAGSRRVPLVRAFIDDELVAFGRAAARFRAHGIRVAVEEVA